MRISDWSSDVCSSDLRCALKGFHREMGKELVVDHHLDLAKAGLCHWEILRNLGAEIYYEDLRETRIVGNNGTEGCGLRLVAQLCWDEVFLAGALFDVSVSLCCPGGLSRVDRQLRLLGRLRRDKLAGKTR